MRHPLAWTSVVGVQNPSMEVIQYWEGMVATVPKSTHSCCAGTLQLGEGCASYSAICSWKSEGIDQALILLILSVHLTTGARL